MPNGDNETVTLKLPSGEMVDVIVPAGLSDAAIRTLALSKRPDLFQSQEPSFLDAAKQAHQTTDVIGRGMHEAPPFPFGEGSDALQITSPRQEQYLNERIPLVNQRVKDVRKQALTAAGASFGGEAGQLASNLPGWISALATASGAGFGAGAGNLAGGGGPKEALGTAAATAATTLPFSGIVTPMVEAGMSKIAALYGRTPAELAELSALPAREAAIQKNIQDGARMARRVASARYPEIATPVDVAPVQSVAQQVQEQLVAHAAPGIVNRVANLPGVPQLDLGQALVTQDVAQMLQQIGSRAEIPFNDAQQLYSALGEAAARGRRMLPGEVYSSIQAVRQTLADQMSAAAEAEGKLAQFQAAQKGWKAYMDAFWNPEAPVKPLLSPAAKNNQYFTLKKLVSDNRGNIRDTLEDFGIDTSDIRALQEMDKKNLLKTVADAAELDRMGPEAFQKAAGEQARQQMIDQAKKLIVPTGIGALLYEVFKRGRGAQAAP
jgi:hypothetical protein